MLKDSYFRFLDAKSPEIYFWNMEEIRFDKIYSFLVLSEYLFLSIPGRRNSVTFYEQKI